MYCIPGRSNVPGNRYLPRYQVRTSWASLGVARALDWPCPAQYDEFGGDIFTRFSSCMNQQMESLPEFFFFFGTKDM